MSQQQRPNYYFDNQGQRVGVNWSNRQVRLDRYGRPVPPPPGMGYGTTRQQQRISIPDRRRPSGDARGASENRRERAEPVLSPGRYNDLATAWDVVREAVFITWPLLMLIPVFAPGKLSDSAALMMYIAAGLWVVAYLTMLFVWKRNKTGHSAFWPIVFVLFMFATLAALLLVAYFTGLEPCPI